MVLPEDAATGQVPAATHRCFGVDPAGWGQAIITAAVTTAPFRSSGSGACMLIRLVTPARLVPMLGSGPSGQPDGFGAEAAESEVLVAFAPPGDGGGDLPDCQRLEVVDVEVDGVNQCSQGVDRPGPFRNHLVPRDHEDPQGHSRPVGETVLGARSSLISIP